MAQERGRGLRGSRLKPAWHRGRGWQGFLQSALDGEPATSWTALRKKVATADAARCTWAPRGVFGGYGLYEKEMKCRSLGLACVVQRCSSLRLACHLGPTLPQRARIPVLPFLKSSSWDRKRGGERGRAELQLVFRVVLGDGFIPGSLSP